MTPSTHMHQIVGSVSPFPFYTPHHKRTKGNEMLQNAFNASMPYADIAGLASCTSCHVSRSLIICKPVEKTQVLRLRKFTQDLSNYWTANLYYKARNGTYKRVPQIANQFNPGDVGGITVYYTSAAPNASTAFTPVHLLHLPPLPSTSPFHPEFNKAEWQADVQHTGLPHAHRRRHAPHTHQPGQKQTTVLPLLPGARLGRQPVPAVHGPEVGYRAPAHAAVSRGDKVECDFSAVSLKLSSFAVWSWGWWMYG